MFDPSPDNFTAARAIATNNGVPGAILRAVVTNETLSPNAFNSLDGFVDTTSRIYVSTAIRKQKRSFIYLFTNIHLQQTQHLALVAKNTYFLAVNDTLPAVVTSLRPRLVIECASSLELDSETNEQI